ncbi:unnamed protein product [Hermetia illucens]|uniref:Uncharacterized protein n=1 Tax=Hermetia illucens TaxID=343691 RepID=A0A7R8UDW0_HERIL|nr:unnamed protein product [Hermetia illucens]
MLKFLCVLLIAVSITSGLPADDVPQKDLKIQQSVPSPAAQEPVPATSLKTDAEHAGDETLSGADNKDEKVMEDMADGADMADGVDTAVGVEVTMEAGEDHTTDIGADIEIICWDRL